MKHTALISILAIAVAAFASCADNTDCQCVLPSVTSHRGCWLENLVPENSVSGIYMARRFGYPAIECDVKYTLDSVMVVMHDKTVNRTMRKASDYSEIAEPVVVTETLFKDLRDKYVFASDDPAERKQIPTLEELLTACKECGIHPVLHSEVLESFDLAHEMLGDDWTAFSVNYDAMKYARSISACEVLWDPGTLTAEETVARVEELGGNTGMSTMKWKMLDAAYIATVKEGGHPVQSSIFPTPHEADAIYDGANVILSDFCWLQQEGRTPAKFMQYKDKSFASGEEFSYVHPQEMPYGAMTLELDYSGAIEVTVNGDRKYEFTSDEPSHRIIGFRFSRKTPEVRIRAIADSKLDKAVLNIYEI